MRNRAIITDLSAGALPTAGLALLVAWQTPATWTAVSAALCAYALAATVLGIAFAGRSTLGWANRVTLLRCTIVCALTGALVVPQVFVERSVIIMAAVGLALALDGIDGWLARRLGESGTIGARFDMETDAALILVLCAGLWLSGQAPAWVLAIGLMRPAFVLGGLIVPALSMPLPDSFRRKLVCVIQVGALPVALLPVLPEAARLTLLAAALLALAASFGADIAWLSRRRRSAEPSRWRTP